MKKKIYFLFFLLGFTAVLDVFMFNVGTAKRFLSKDKYIKKEKALGGDLTDEEIKRPDDIEKSQIVRYIEQHDEMDIYYNKTAFYSADNFYLGAAGSAVGASIDSSAFIRAFIKYDSSAQTKEVMFTPLAPEEVYLNDEKVDDKPALVANPIYNNKISNLSLMGQYPVLTLVDAANVGAVNFAENQLVCLIDALQGGGSVKTNTEKLKDAAGADATVQGIVGSGDTIFAAVYPAGGRFGETNHSGFTRLIRNESKNLKQVENTAVPLNLNAANTTPVPAPKPLLAITQDAKVAGLGDMYWDSTLQRLFIGLVGAERSGGGNGGAISVLVGRIENGNLVIEPSVPLESALFNDPDPVNTNDYAIGFYRTNAVVSKAFAYKLRTMHASTGKTYLIINGGVANATIKNRFYALPLISESDNPTNIGKVAKKTDFTTVPAALADMSKSTDSAVEIGVTGLIENDKDVRDMFVVGDSVYVCLAENRTADNEAGIFRSTAIFDDEGRIRAWTPWQRVMGNVDKVYGAGFDATEGNFWYLTNDNAPVPQRNTVKVTQWGQSEQINGLMGNGLVEILSEEFKQEDGGVHQIFNFDEKTPCLARTTAANELSIMVATGYQKVAIIKTGSGSPFTQEGQFIKDPTDPNRNVYVWDNNDALKNIGPICCAEVSRYAAPRSGWLFVGGYNGLAVVREGVEGYGWNGDPAPVPNAPVDLNTVSGWSFKELKKTDGSSFNQVRKIICEPNNLFMYVINGSKIYRVAMAYKKFKDNTPDPLGEKTLNSPSGFLLDMQILYVDRGTGDTRLLVATTEGLFSSSLINNTDEDKNNLIWTKVELNSTNSLSSPVSHLSFISNQKGGFTTNGNLYAVSADLAFNLANIYRFNVGGGAIHFIPEVAQTDYFYSIGEIRTNFLTDGTLGFNLLPKHFGDSDFLRKINISSDQANMKRLANTIDLDLDESAYNIGVITQNTASGAWIVPGDWGIRVND